MSFNAKNVFDKELKHRSLSLDVEKTDTLKVKIQALILL